ncbi:alpha/beta fold hydrolase [Lapillicoccus sp.]|uniref:alpha/beta fold hydrolase n=1 Tax=Lapillicoccus sp. TaxID=1909287 RepID=UPI003264943B
MNRLPNFIALAGLVAGSMVAALTVAPAANATMAPLSTAPVAALQYDTPPISWGTCGDPGLAQAGAQCGFVTVPLDYAKPHAATVQIAVSRVVHTVPASAYQGVILVNLGGPGGSGLTASLYGGAIPGGVGTDYDWIGFDPRGVGASIPALSCDPNHFGPDRPNYVPTSTALLQVWLDRSKQYAQACQAAQPALLRNMRTVDQAQDIDQIRRALGVPQISFYAYSYGTYLGSVYNTLFPGRLRRAVFDSNVDPRQIWYRTNLRQNQVEQNSLRLFWSWIALHHDVYNLGDTELAVERRYYDFRAKLLVHPAAGIVGADEIDDAFDDAAYTPQYFWPYLAEDWANYIHHGDTYYLQVDYQIADGPGNDNLVAVYLGTECTDSPWPGKQQQLADAYRTQPAASFYTWNNFWFNAPCIFWPAPAAAPTTIVGGTLAPLLLDDYSDGPTPYTGDLEVRRLYPDGRLIGLPGSNHGVSLNGNPCVDNNVAAYLATGALPARKPGNTADATCPPMPTPVPVTYPGTPTTSQPATAGGAAAHARTPFTTAHLGRP